MIKSTAPRMPLDYTITDAVYLCIFSHTYFFLYIHVLFFYSFTFNLNFVERVLQSKNHEVMHVMNPVVNI